MRESHRGSLWPREASSRNLLLLLKNRNVINRDRFELLQDPNWLDLMPISALGLGTHALPHVGSGKKNEVAVMVISFVPQIMLPKVRIHLITRSIVYIICSLS